VSAVIVAIRTTHSAKSGVSTFY